MKRGMLEISDQELEIFKTLLSQHTNQVASHLKSRIEYQHHGGDIQLNEEEADVLVDLLPIPGEHTQSQELELRKKLLEFLRKLRS